MEGLFSFDLHYLIPAALVGAVIAVVLLIVSRGRNGARPSGAKRMRIAAALLLIFAGIALVVIPIVHFIWLVVKFGFAVLYSGLKSL